MSELAFIEELELAIDAMLRGAQPRVSQAEVAELVAIARDLRYLPSENFRTRLQKEIAVAIQKEAEMTATATSKQQKQSQELQTVTPYLTVSDVHAEIAFVESAFGAKGKIYGLGSAGGFHSEYKIADTLVMIGGGGEGSTWKGTPTRAALHVYVEDVDFVYERALAAGATSLMPPTDQEYQDRDAAVADVNGNHWYIGTHKGPRYVPEDGQPLMPALQVNGADRMIDFFKQALGASEIAVYKSPDGIVRHAKLSIGNSVIEIGEAHGKWKANHMNFMLYVDDVDAQYARFMQTEGAKSISEPSDQPYGARVGTVEDPFGNQWYIAKRSHKTS